MARQRTKVSEEIKRFWRLLDPKVSLERAWYEINSRREGAAYSTIEALMFSLRRGPDALAEPNTLRRLAELDERQLLTVMTRLQKFKPEIAASLDARTVGGPRRRQEKTMNEKTAEQIAEEILAKAKGKPNGKTPPPHVERGEGAVLLDDVSAFLKRFIAYPSEHAHIAHVLWIAHTHSMGSWESTPRIAFLSPEPGSGKTRSMEVSELLVPDPVAAVNVTPAYLFRKCGSEDGPPTILFDEIDTVFGARARENEELRALLNSGHRRGATAGRCVVRGKNIETEEITSYAAVALAGLGLAARHDP